MYFVTMSFYVFINEFQHRINSLKGLTENWGPAIKNMALDEYSWSLGVQ